MNWSVFIAEVTHTQVFLFLLKMKHKMIILYMLQALPGSSLTCTVTTVSYQLLHVLFWDIIVMEVAFSSVVNGVLIIVLLLCVQDSSSGTAASGHKESNTGLEVAISSKGLEYCEIFSSHSPILTYPSPIPPPLTVSCSVKYLEVDSEEGTGQVGTERHHRHREYTRNKNTH